jgi:hypothetical protein
MRLAALLIPAFGLLLAACSSSSGGGSAAPSKTYIVMPSGQTVPCNAGNGTTCP